MSLLTKEDREIIKSLDLDAVDLAGILYHNRNQDCVQTLLEDLNRLITLERKARAAQ